jgi:hypothetical protein
VIYAAEYEVSSYVGVSGMALPKRYQLRQSWLADISERSLDPDFVRVVRSRSDTALDAFVRRPHMGVVEFQLFSAEYTQALLRELHVFEHWCQLLCAPGDASTSSYGREVPATAASIHPRTPVLRRGAQVARQHEMILHIQKAPNLRLHADAHGRAAPAYSTIQRWTAQ